MKRSQHRWIIILSICILTIGEFVVDINTPRGYADWIGYFIPMLLSLYVGRRRFSLWLGAILSVLMGVGLYLSPIGVEPKAELNRAFGIAILWVMAGLVVQDKRLKKEVQRVKRALMAIRDCNQALVRVTDELALLEKVCRIIVEDGGYHFAWIGFAEDDAAKTVRPVAHAGHEAGYLEKAKLTWADTERGRGPTGTAMRTGQAVLCKNVLTDPQFAPWREDAIQRGYIGSVALPLLSEGKAFGVLSIYSAVPDAFNTEEVNLLMELAGDLAFGIQALRAGSARERAEAALAEERNLLTTLLDNIPDKIYFKDCESRFLRINPAHARQFGLGNPAEAIGKTDANFFSEEHARQAYEDEHAIISTGEPLVGKEEKETWPDGRVEWASTTKMPLRDATGKIVGTFGISRDITERKQAEEIVRESEEQFRTLVENSPDAIFVQTGRRFVYLNAAALQLFGATSAEQIIGQGVAERVHPDFRDAVKQRQILTEQQKSAPTFEEVYLKVDGTPMPVEVNAAPINYRGQPGAVVFVRDISERKRVENELADSQGRLKAIFDYASDGILAADVEQMSLLLCNPRICQMLGYSQEEMYSLKVRDIHPEESLPYVLDRFQKQANKEIALSRDIPVKRKDGSVLYADVNSFPLTLGGRKCLAGFFRDITERKQVEEKIRQLMTEQETILDTVAAGIGFLKKRKLQWINPAFARMFGYEPQEITGVDSLMFYADAEDYQRLGRDGYAQLAAGGIYTAEFLMKKKGGSRFWCSLTGRAINSRNLDEGSIWVLNDITERRQAEAALRESEDNFKQAQALAHVGYWSRDLMTNLVQWSEETFRIFGLSPQAGPVESKIFFEIIHPDDRERITREISEALAGTKSHDVEYRVVRPDGTVRFVHAIGEVFRDPSGKPLRLSGSVTDITEPKQAAGKIAEQAALLDKAQDAIFVLDLGRRVTYWNKGAEKLFGWTAAEAIGELATDLMFRGIVTQQLQEAIKTTEQECGEWTGELEECTKDDRRIIVQMRSTLIRDERGRPKAILIIDTDITEKKKLEAQFLRAQRMESIGVLAGGVAHDLNNVLAPLMVSVQILKEKATDEEGQRLLEILKTNVQRGADLVRQVLAFGRGVKGQRLLVQPGHLAREIAQVVHEIFPKSVQFECRLPSQPWNVTGDPTQIHQVLLNLCINARDAMPLGGRLSLVVENIELDTVPVGLNPDARPGRYVCFNVTDTGMGIPKEIQDKIFDPFFTTKEPGKGTGLGLSTSLGIIRSHGGFINLYSEAGRGTTFKVYLAANPAPATTETGVTPLDNSLPRGRNELVLVVDDEEPVRHIVQKTLELHGYRVLTAANGAEALALYAVRQHAIDVVITDIVMPIMDGPATIVALKSMNPDIKIIASSGIELRDSGTKAAAANVQHFIPKPYPAEVLLRTLDKLLHPKPSSA